MTSAVYQSTFNTLVGRGYRLRCVSGYESNGQALYAAIWDKSSGPAWQAHHDMNSTAYQNEFNQLVSQGYRLRWVSGYVVNGTDLYAAIWDKSSGGHGRRGIECPPVPTSRRPPRSPRKDTG